MIVGSQRVTASERLDVPESWIGHSRVTTRRGRWPAVPSGSWRRYTFKLWVFDAAALQLGSVDPAGRPLVADLVLGSKRLNRIAEHFVSWTGR